MGERHSYGTSCGCVSRRVFIFVFCCVMAVICAIQLARWATRWHVFDALVGAPWQPVHYHCTGTQCYEVFSCFGMKEATQHLREPLSSSIGVLLFPVGAHAAHHGFRRPLQVLGVYLALAAAVHAGIVVADLVYYDACDAYPANLVLQTLVNEVLPPSPLSPAARQQIRQMGSFPAGAVDRITGGFPALAWYVVWAGLWVLVLAYAAREARLLGDLVERGPLGLGVHYGLDQWDQVVSHDAIRRHKEREMRSQFIDDARLPLGGHLPDETPALGHKAGGRRGYGAADGGEGPL